MHEDERRDNVSKMCSLHIMLLNYEQNWWLSKGIILERRYYTLSWHFEPSSKESAAMQVNCHIAANQLTAEV